MKKTREDTLSGDLYCCWVQPSEVLVTSWDPWNGPGVETWHTSIFVVLDRYLGQWNAKLEAETSWVSTFELFKKWMVFQVSNGGFKSLFGRNCRIFIMFWTAVSILTCWNTDVSTAEIPRCQLLLLPSVNQHGNEESTWKTKSLWPYWKWWISSDLHFYVTLFGGWLYYIYCL